MRSFRNKPVGWRNESHRHYLAAKGISTKLKMQNRKLLNKWKMLDADEVYVDKKTGKVVAAYDKANGVGEALSDDVLKSDDIVLAKKGKYFASKKDGVYETQYGNAAAVSFEDGKWRAYDLDSGEVIPISMVTKKRIRDLDEGEGSLWEDEDEEYFASKENFEKVKRDAIEMYESPGVKEQFIPGFVNASFYIEAAEDALLELSDEKLTMEQRKAVGTELQTRHKQRIKTSKMDNKNAKDAEEYWQKNYERTGRFGLDMSGEDKE